MTAAAAATVASTLPPGYWDLDRTAPLVDKTLTVRLAPDLSKLTAGERAAVGKLLEAGEIFQKLYEESRHREARSSLAALKKLEDAKVAPDAVRNLLTLYRMHQGPITTTLDNNREPFLPVAPAEPGKAVYPKGATRAEIEAFLAAHPESRASLLDAMTVVRRADVASIRADLETLRAHPVLDLLHPGLSARLRALPPSPGGFYAVPYAIAYAKDLVAAYRLLMEAADAVAPDDASFAAYLRHRARDLVANDYEAGDASWVTGRFKHLNAQIGAFETYDDSLYGVKAFFSLSLLLRDEAESARVAEAIAGLQAVEDSLPYEPRRKVRTEIPVGVYDVIADFGQARGTNTATILPNDPEHTRKYGRTILLRRNIMLNPELFAERQRTWTAALADVHHADLRPEGGFQRTLWHEVGHYLGADRDRQGRPLDEALQDDADLLEEMKSDLVSLHTAPILRARGHFDEAALHAVMASGIDRTLQDVKPRRDQPYQTMQVIQMNWFLKEGLLSWDADGRLRIDYSRYAAAVDGLLKEVLALQANGDKAAADRFIDTWAVFGEKHEALAAKVRAAQRSRFRLPRYAALGE